MILPDATSVPCNDCPWRRAAAPGWLGPFDASMWLAIARSDAPIACHLTIRSELVGPDSMTVPERWDQPGLRQCRGAAIYRCNTAKMPRHLDDARHESESDLGLVFGSEAEFLAHHGQFS